MLAAAERLRQIPVPKTDDPVGWALEYMRTERGQPLDFAAHFYMPGILQDRSPLKGFLCGSQVGKTTMAICEAYCLADTWARPLRIIYTMHTDKAVQEFSQTRARQAIEASSYLRDKVGAVNNVYRKTMLRRVGVPSVILFKGASQGQQALSEPADVVFHDEVDFSRPDVLDLYEDRIAHSEVAWRRAFGTPTVPGFGVSALWEKSTQTEWLVTCPYCGDERPLTWPASFAADAEQPHLICSHGHELTWETVRESGQWAQAQPGADWSMYRIPRALLRNWPAERIVQAFDQARFPQLFFNQVMGQPAASEELAVNEAVVQACIGEHRPAERDDGPCFLGADPGRVIHYCIGKRLPDGQRQYLQVGSVPTWEALADLMPLFNVRLAVIDGAYDATKAKEFSHRFPRRVLLAYYPRQPIKGEDPVVINEDSRLVYLDRTTTLDIAADRLILQRDVLPMADHATHREMVAQLTAMQRGMEVGTDGIPKAFWAETGPDHLRHAHNYASVAAEQMGGDMKISYVRQGPLPVLQGQPAQRLGRKRNRELDEIVTDTQGREMKLSRALRMARRGVPLPK